MSEKIPIPEQGIEPLLTLEQFTPSRYNNFYLYFAVAGTDNIADYAYSRKPHIQKFVRENAELAANLCNKIQNERNRGSSKFQGLEQYNADLYEAYKIMRGYGVSNWDLFS